MNCATRWRWGSQRWTLLSRQSYFCPTRPTDLRRLTSGRMKISFVNTILTFVVLVITWQSHSRTPHEATWAPVLWALNLLCRARQEGKITLEPPVTILYWKSTWNMVQVWANMVTAFEYVEDCNRKVLNYGWIEFPLAYTQVRCWEWEELGWRRTQTLWCRWQPSLSMLTSLPPSSVASSLNHGGSTSQYSGNSTCFVSNWYQSLLPILACSTYWRFFAATTQPFQQFQTWTLLLADPLPTTPQVLIIKMIWLQKHPQNSYSDVYIPIFTIVEFISYLGWIKVWFPPFLTCLHCSSKDTWWIRWQKPFSIHLGTMTKTLKWIIWSIGTCR